MFVTVCLYEYALVTAELYMYVLLSAPGVCVFVNVLCAELIGADTDQMRCVRVRLCVSVCDSVLNGVWGADMCGGLRCLCVP